MRRLIAMLPVLTPALLGAQESLPTPRAELLNHFEMSIRKVGSLYIGITGEFMRYLPITLIATLSAAFERLGGGDYAAF